MAKESSASRRARVKLQLRDRKGRWIKMGVKVKWFSHAANKDFVGTVVGNSNSNGMVSVELPSKSADGKKQTIDVPSSMVEVVAAKATLGQKIKSKVTGKEVKTSPLKPITEKFDGPLPKIQEMLTKVDKLVVGDSVYGFENTSEAKNNYGFNAKGELPKIDQTNVGTVKDNKADKGYATITDTDDQDHYVSKSHSVYKKPSEADTAAPNADVVDSTAKADLTPSPDVIETDIAPAPKAGVPEKAAKDYGYKDYTNAEVQNKDQWTKIDNASGQHADIDKFPAGTKFQEAQGKLAYVKNEEGKFDQFDAFMGDNDKSEKAVLSGIAKNKAKYLEVFKPKEDGDVPLKANTKSPLTNNPVDVVTASPDEFGPDYEPVNFNTGANINDTFKPGDQIVYGSKNNHGKVSAYTNAVQIAAKKIDKKTGQSSSNAALFYITPDQVTGLYRKKKAISSDAPESNPEAVEAPAPKAVSPLAPPSAEEIDEATSVTDPDQQAKINSLDNVSKGAGLSIGPDILIKQGDGSWSESDGHHLTSEEILAKFTGKKAHVIPADSLITGDNLAQPQPSISPSYIPKGYAGLNSQPPQTTEQLESQLPEADLAKFSEELIGVDTEYADNDFSTFPGYSDAQMVAIKDYIGDSFEINHALRNDTSADKFTIKNILAMDQIMKESKLTKDTTVYRGIFADETTLAKLNVGGVYHDNGFTSTSLSDSKAKGWVSNVNENGHSVVLEMRLPAGYNAHRIDYEATETDDYADEQEIILPRGVQFKVASKETYEIMPGKFGTRFVVEPVNNPQGEDDVQGKPGYASYGPQQTLYNPAEGSSNTEPGGSEGSGGESFGGVPSSSGTDKPLGTDFAKNYSAENMAKLPEGTILTKDADGEYFVKTPDGAWILTSSEGVPSPNGSVDNAFLNTVLKSSPTYSKFYVAPAGSKDKSTDTSTNETGVTPADVILYDGNDASDVKNTIVDEFAAQDLNWETYSKSAKLFEIKNSNNDSVLITPNASGWKNTYQVKDSQNNFIDDINLDEAGAAFDLKIILDDAFASNASTNVDVPSNDDTEVGDTVSSDVDPKVQEIVDSPKELVDVSKWNVQPGSQGGSNPGGIYTDPDGNKFYVKKSKTADHARNEVLANQLYELTGIKAVDMELVDTDGNGSVGTKSVMIDGAKNNLSNKLKTDDVYRKEFQSGWAVDAWLGNWDVVGLEFDNTVTDANGEPVRVDPGGALLFRAMGSPKSAGQFTNSVDEWDNMRTQEGLSPQTYSAFHDMTDQQIYDSVQKVAAVTDADIDALVNASGFDKDKSDLLKERLKARRDDLIQRADALPDAIKNVEPSVVDVNAPNDVIPNAEIPDIAPVSELDQDTDMALGTSPDAISSAVGGAIDEFSSILQQFGFEDVFNGWNDSDFQGNASDISIAENVDGDFLRLSVTPGEDGLGKLNLIDTENVVFNSVTFEELDDYDLHKTITSEVIDWQKKSFENSSDLPGDDFVDDAEVDTATSVAQSTTQAPSGEAGTIGTDADGNTFMNGTDSVFYKGDTVSYTKKGVTQSGEVVALYPGVQSAKVKFEDGTSSIKKIKTLSKADAVSPKADTDSGLAQWEDDLLSPEVITPSPSDIASDPTLAEWEKELLDPNYVSKATSESAPETATEETEQAPVGLEAGQAGVDPATGEKILQDKDNSTLVKGSKVQYTLKGVTKTGAVHNVMVNQNSAKVNWDDGTSSIVKGSKISKVSTNENTTSPEATTPETPKVPTAQNVTSETPVSPTEWTAASQVSDFPIGTAVTSGTLTFTKSDDNEWTFGYSKVNDTVLQSHLTDNFNSGTNIETVLPEAASDVSNDVTPVLDKPVWGNSTSVYNMPIGTVIENGTYTFVKASDDQWTYGEYSKSPNNVIQTHLEHQADLGNDIVVTLPESQKNAAEPVVETATPQSTVNLNKLPYEKIIDNFTFKTVEQPIGTKLKSNYVDVTKMSDSEWANASSPGNTYQDSSVQEYVETSVDDITATYAPGTFDLNTNTSASPEDSKAFTNESTQATQAQAEAYVNMTDGLLSGMTTEQLSALPADTVLNVMVNGKVSGSYVKEEGKWRYKAPGDEKYSNLQLTNAEVSFVADQPIAKNIAVVLPGSGEQPAEAPVVIVPEVTVEKGVVKGKLSPGMLAEMPVGTVIREEVSPYYGQSTFVILIKQPDGTWNRYNKTAKTMPLKASQLSDGEAYSSMKYQSSISKPAGPDSFWIGNGEHVSTGDVVYVQGMTHKPLTIVKNGKTAVTVTEQDGTEKKVKATTLFSDLKYGHAVNQNNSYNDKYSYKDNFSDPIGQSFKIKKNVEENLAKVEKAKNAVKNFAGADAEAYNAQGLSTPVAANYLENMPSGQSVVDITGEVDSELKGQPEPTQPQAIDEYPDFNHDAPINLPKWDSAEWLEKVKQRYLDNPNKAKATLEESVNWAKVNSIINQENNWKSHLSALLSSKYLDDDLHKEALVKIEKQDQLNKPIMEDFNANKAKALEDYNIKKAEYFAEYDTLFAKYNEDYNKWSAANAGHNFIKPIVMPTPSSENFIGGVADWTKAHKGTHSAQTVFDSIRDDDTLGTHGLSFAADASQIEELNVSMHKVLDENGVEVLDARFKITHAFANELAARFESESVKKTSDIYLPWKKKVDGSELLQLDGKPTASKKIPGNTSGMVVSGDRYVYTDPDTGAKIIFQRADNASGTDDPKAHYAHNTMQVVMPKDASPAEFQTILANLGISAKPASEGDLRVLAENKLLVLFAKDEANGNENTFDAAKRKKLLDGIESEFGITPNNVIARTDSTGRVNMFLDDASAQKLLDKSGYKYMHHGLADGDDDIVVSMIASNNSGLNSTAHRWAEGIGYTGQSSGPDMNLGSSDGVYISPKAHSPETNYGNAVHIDPLSIFRRLDTWANNSDNYGAKNYHGSFGKPGMAQLTSGSNTHEVMPRYSVPLTDIQRIVVSSNKSRQNIIDRLKKLGIIQVNGQPLEKFIQVTGEVTSDPVAIPPMLIEVPDAVDGQNIPAVPVTV